VPTLKLQRLMPRHYKIIDLSLAGLSPSDIAKEVGLTPRSISLITRSPVFQGELARRRKTLERDVDDAIVSGVDKARERIDELAGRAAEVQEGLLESDSEMMQSTTARDILDRTIGKKGEGSSGTMVRIDADQINILQVALEEVRGDV